MPNLAERKQEKFGGANLAGEPQRIPMSEFETLRNWDNVDDESIESAPGYTTEIELAKRRQVATAERDETWTGDAVANTANKTYGFQSQKHVHGGAGAKTSTFTRALSFLDDFADTDSLSFWLFVTTVANLTSVEVRFRKDGANYFSTTLTIPGADSTAAVTSKLRSAFSTTGALTWIEVVDVQVISTASGATDASFDDFFISSPLAADNSDPITGLHGFPRLGTIEKYLMAAAGDSVYSIEGSAAVKRDAKLGVGQMVHMVIANDQVFALNGVNPVKRWAPAEAIFQDAGVPAPTDTMTMTQGVAGLIADGTYHGVTVFDMGIHGHGNPNPTPSSVTLAAGPAKIDYAAVPLGPPGTVRRLIYRTIKDAGSGATKFLDVIITDNITTTATSNNVDSVIQTAGALVEDADLPPIGNYARYLNNDLYIAGVTTAKSSVFYSNTTGAANRTIEQFPVLNEIKLNPDDGDFIVGMEVYRGALFVFKQHSFYRIDPVRKTPRLISSVDGAITQRSISTDGNILAFWTPDEGLVVYDGGAVRKVGVKTKGKDDQVVDAHRINSNPLGTTLDGFTWTFENDFEAGVGGTGTPVFNDTNADDKTGSVVLDRGGVGELPANSAPKPGVAATQEAVFYDAQPILPLVEIPGTPITSSNLFVATPNAARDGTFAADATSPKWTLSMNAFPFVIGGAQKRVNAKLTITFPTTRTIKRIRIQTVNKNDSGLIIAYGRIYPKYNSAGTFVDIPGVAPRIWPPVSNIELQFMNMVLPTPVTTDKIQLDVWWQGRGNIGIAEIEIYEEGYETDGDWTSDIVDFAVAPDAFGLIQSAIVDSGPNVKVEIYMRSADTTPEFDSSLPWILQTRGTKPTIDKKRFAQVHIKLFGDGTQTPSFDELTLLFRASAVGVVKPLTETNGIFFEDRFWYNIIRRDQATPDITWKLFRFAKWSEHDDYQMSAWGVHRNALFSGSAINGRVYRNVRTDAGIRIKNKDGRNIRCFGLTKDWPFGKQQERKSIRELLAAARNERIFDDQTELIINGGFEDWVDPVGSNLNTLPNGWTRTGARPNVFRNDDPRHVAAGQLSAHIRPGLWLPQGSAVLGADEAIEAVFSLENSTDYTLKFRAKLHEGVGPDILQVISNALAGTLYLQPDGTWDAAVANLNAGLIFEDRMNQYEIPFQTHAAVESGTVAFKLGWSGPATIARTTLYLDEVSVKKSPTATPGELLLIPKLDREDQLPPRRMALSGPDLAVITEKFRVDRAGVKNMAVALIHDESNVSCKVMGLWARIAGERTRDGDN